MKEKAEFNKKNVFFCSHELILFKPESNKGANLLGLGSDLILFTFERCFEINLVILLTWIRNRSAIPSPS